MPRDVNPLVVSSGDPSGVGPDLIIAAWSRRKDIGLPSFVVTGDSSVIEARARLLGIGIKIAEIDSDNLETAKDDVLNVIRTGNQQGHPGKPSPQDAAVTISSIETAVELVAKGHCRGLVTCPINKKILYENGFQFPGHTEYLEALSGQHFPDQQCKAVMMLAAPELRTVPVTIHVPLEQVPTSLDTVTIVETGHIVVRELKAKFGISNPRLVVSGLNPHAGEQGEIGSEDRDIIGPAVQELVEMGVDATGPWPADTLFHANRRNKYDAALCMYHDQALIPVKALYFDDTVNVTLGLPFIRTSPDHGSAYDVAGTGNANPASFIAAMKLAAKMSDGS